MSSKHRKKLHKNASGMTKASDKSKDQVPQKKKKKKKKKAKIHFIPELDDSGDRSEAFSLPEGVDKNKNKYKPVSDAEADPNSILNEERERMHLYGKTSREIELEEEEVAELVQHELALQEHKRFNAVLHYLQVTAAKADVFAAAHTMPKHQVCIFVAFAMIPMSILTITWDLLATEVFEIPHLSTINAPGFILVINFAAMPLAMYGFMMEYLMYENSREAIIGLICVIVHPILFLTRAFMEYYFDGYRNEMKLYFETPQQGDDLIYPVGVLTSTGPLDLVSN